MAAAQAVRNMDAGRRRGVLWAAMRGDGCPWCGAAHPERPLGSTLITCGACRRTSVAAGATRIPLATRFDDPAAIDGDDLVSLPDRFLARYRLGRVLGRGAMGMVCQATHRETGREVAIKLLVRPRDTEALARLLQEGRTLARMRHPNVIQVLDMDEAGGHPYLVMELMDGGSLRDLMSRTGRVDPETAVRLARGCLSGLAACHAASTVHRDVKPENILFASASDLEPRIADLGIARTYDRVERLTRTGVVMGTPLYMAPEQMLGDDPGPAADLHAIGAILYELLSGQHPYPARSYVELHRLVTGTQPARLRQVVPAVPAALDAAVHRALSKRPVDRPPSAESLADELAAAVERGPAPRSPSAPSSEPAAAPAARQRSRPPARSATLVSAAALCLVLLGLALARTALPPVPGAPGGRGGASGAGRAVMPGLPRPEIEAIRTEVGRIKRERLRRLETFAGVLGTLARLRPESLVESERLARAISHELRRAIERLDTILVKLRGICVDLERAPGPDLLLLADAVAEDLESRIVIDKMTQVADHTARLIGLGLDTIIDVAEFGRIYDRVRLGPQNLSRCRDYFQASVAILERAGRYPAGADPGLGGALAEIFWIGNLFKGTSWQAAPLATFEREVSRFLARTAALSGPAGPAVGRVARGCWLLGRQGLVRANSEELESTVSALGELAIQAPQARETLRSLERMLLERRFGSSGR
jgi:serine/threonine-protein kinase